MLEFFSMIVFYVIEDAQMEIDFNDGIELAATDSADHVAITIFLLH